LALKTVILVKSIIFKKGKVVIMEKLNIRDIEIAYEIKGEGSECIAFLNGVGMSIDHWAPVVAGFEKEYKCLLHDFRGQLLSTRLTSEIDMEIHVEDLKVLLDKLNIKKLHLAGTSYGSEIAMMFAYTYPEMVKSLSVITGVSYTDYYIDTAIESWNDACLKGGEQYFNTMTPWNFSPNFVNSNMEYFKERKKISSSFPIEHFISFTYLAKAFQKLDIRDKIKNIKCPSIAISAEFDMIKRPAMGRMIADNIPGCEFYLIKDSAHAVVVEKPLEVIELVKKLVKKAS
jgi:3-oxoadipate enol-lactonase